MWTPRAARPGSPTERDILFSEVRVLWAVGAVLVACGSGGSSGTAACDDAGNCPAGFACVSGACVATDASAGAGGLDASAGAGGQAGGSGGVAGNAGAGAGGSAGDSGSAGSGGSAGAGGAAGGAAGSGGNAGASGGCTATLIDDMESALGGILPNCDGRSGGWFPANDGLSGTTQWPPLTVGYSFPYTAPGASGAGYAIRSYGTTGSPSGAWGAMVSWPFSGCSAPERPSTSTSTTSNS